jgi:CheY-like chemotaxis protein
VAAATILVADDQDDLRLLMRMLLTRAPHDWTVVEASDGRAALERSREYALDVVILDQRMPELSGTDVARLLRKGNFAGPIVLFSAYLDAEVESAANELELVTLPKSEISRLADVTAAALDIACS